MSMDVNNLSGIDFVTASKIARVIYGDLGKNNGIGKYTFKNVDEYWLGCMLHGTVWWVKGSFFADYTDAKEEWVDGCFYAKALVPQAAKLLIDPVVSEWYDGYKILKGVK